MTAKTYLTQQGLQILNQQLAQLQIRQQHLVTQIEEVAQPDESGQDGLAQQLKEELEVVLAKIDKLETAVNSAKLINKTTSNGTIQIGSRVKIKLADSATQEFEIVDEIEADPSQNKISHQSPIGQALLGKKVNDQVEVDAPVGRVTYKILAIV